MASNTFNENNTSYWHKSIGGYHAAKLRRYQELIEHHITLKYNISIVIFKNNHDIHKLDPKGISVLNMLNTKYFILPLEGGETTPLQNPYAFGNAWFVDNINYVDNANEEIEQLQNVNLQKLLLLIKSSKNL